MTNREIKQTIIDTLFTRGEYIRQVNPVEYQTRCPFCGDSLKNLNTGHLYIRIGLEDNFPMVYNCFKCNEHGIVDQELLDMMEIGDVGLRQHVYQLNKTADKLSAYRFLNSEKEIRFEFERPIVTKDNKTAYIEKRFDRSFNEEELTRMKVITSL